jgi:hypothetical protein
MKWSLVCVRGCKLKAKDQCKVRPLGKRGIYVDHPGSPLSSLAGAVGAMQAGEDIVSDQFKGSTPLLLILGHTAHPASLLLQHTPLCVTQRAI